MAERWMKEIRAQLPKGKKLRILDVGCGAGFFSVLLAKEGHQVTGIDLTPDMVKNARTSCRRGKTDCEFSCNGCRKSRDFRTEAFDVIISRNLTWTLPACKPVLMENGSVY
ncbi:MAG: class I SAM-dependent methyltransferase [Lachnospiraceae bacterium]